MINTLGPEIFPDFDSTRVISGAEANREIRKAHDRTPSTGSDMTTSGVQTPNYADLDVLGPTSSTETGSLSETISRTSSFNNLAYIPIFPSSPTSRSPAGEYESRSMKGNYTLTSGEINRSISGKVAERRRQRERSRSASKRSGVDPMTAGPNKTEALADSRKVR
jgi:glycerol-3-phosphate O-acyltransferase/dihydroxyacetone phosphate acyltransferase